MGDFLSYIVPSYVEYVCWRISCGAVWVEIWKGSPMGHYKTSSFWVSLVLILSVSSNFLILHNECMLLSVEENLYPENGHTCALSSILESVRTLLHGAAVWPLELWKIQSKSGYL